MPLRDPYLEASGRGSSQVYQPMGIENKIVGYVYLVDAECRIRWAGCGTATNEEVESLRAATRVLLDRGAKK